MLTYHADKLAFFYKIEKLICHHSEYKLNLFLRHLLYLFLIIIVVHVPLRYALPGINIAPTSTKLKEKTILLNSKCFISLQKRHYLDDCFKLYVLFIEIFNFFI
jgi:hypothetical protein